MQSRRRVLVATGDIKNPLQALGLAVDVQVRDRILVVGIALVVVCEGALAADVEPERAFDVGQMTVLIIHSQRMEHAQEELCRRT